LFFVLASCSKELLHEPGIPWLEIREVNSIPAEKIKVSFFEETPNIETLKFTFQAHERDMYIPSDEIIFESITSTRDVRDVVSSFKLVIGKFKPLFCSENFPEGFKINLPPVPYRIELLKDSVVEIAVYMTSKKIGDIYNTKTIYEDGTKLRVLLPSSIKVFDMDDNQIKGVYGSAWGPWLEFSR
jgi:hypothetical protein